jgi:hypothetical protein
MSISKKIMALILALILALSLFACSDKSAGGSASPSASPASESTPPASDTGAASPSGEASASPSAGESPSKQGYYDPEKDYFDREPYQVAFLIQQTPTNMHNMYIDAYRRCGTKLNFELTDLTANNDSDQYLNMLQTLAGNYDAFFLNFDTELKSRAVELTEELELVWFPGLSTYRDENGLQLSPSQSMDNEKYGADMTVWLADTAKQQWGDFDHKELGMITIDYSTNVDIHARETGAHNKFQELFPDIAETNYWVADGSTQGSFSADVAFNIVSPLIAVHPDIKYWIIASTMDDYANGAARAVEGADKQDNTLIIATGGVSLIPQWDKGMQSCWKACIYSEANLVSMIDGVTTPETLWPNWIQPGQKYPLLRNPCYLLTYDNYQDFFAWVDKYTGFDLYDYPDRGVEFEYNVQ